MGGKAFAEAHGNDAGLSNFPRMPPALYQQLLEKVLEVLSRSYDTVRVPAEAPEKEDHGDIDVLVHSSKRPDSGGKEHLATLAVALSARQTRFFGWGRWSLAVPFSSPCFEAVDIGSILSNGDDDAAAAHVQIDLRVCQTVDKLNWVVFKNAYGDLWQILGVIIRPYGLTCDESHLNVRIQEVEDNGGSKDEQRVKLTRDPVETMKYLGLDSDAYAAGFSTEVAIFEWAVRCRFFHTASLFRHRDEDEGEGEGEALTESNNLKHNDRQRFRKRPMYTRFRTWVHDNIDTLSQRNTDLSRPLVFAEAITRFDAQAQIDKVLPRFRLKIREKVLKQRVATALRQAMAGSNIHQTGAKTGELNLTPTNAQQAENIHSQMVERRAGNAIAEPEEQNEAGTEELTRVMRGLRNFVHFDTSGMPLVSDQSQTAFGEGQSQPHSQTWSDCALNDDDFVAWILAHYEQVDALELARREEGGRKAYEERQRRRENKKVGLGKENSIDQTNHVDQELVKNEQDH